MYICNCRGVSEKTLIAKLKELKDTFIHTKRRGDQSQPAGSINLDELHEACSGGAGFQCCKCVRDFKDIAKEHNQTLARAQTGQQSDKRADNMSNNDLHKTAAALQPANDPAIPAVKINTPQLL